MTAHDPICPHCGYDLVHNAPILIDKWSMSGPGSPLFYEGRTVKLTGAESEVCYSLLKAFPKKLDRWVLRDRLGSECADNVNIVNVYVCRIRKTLAQHGLPCPIATVWGRGYRWMADHEMDQ